MNRKLRVLFSLLIGIGVIVPASLVVMFNEPTQVTAKPITPVTPPGKKPHNPKPPVSPSVPVNSAPSIKTKSLKSAKVNLSYSALIVATDKDNDDSLSMTASGLPQGITMINCYNTIQSNGSQAGCNIAGTPTKSGRYNVVVTVTDKSGAEDTQNYTLLVK